MKKITAILLSFIIAAMFFPILTGSGKAYAENGYPYSVAAGVYVADQWGFYQCECTSYCAYKLNTVNGVYFHNTKSHGSKWGNAKDWDDFARTKGITVNTTPAVGSIAYWDSNHVAWVSAVSGNNITIEEYNYGYVNINGVTHGSHTYNTRTISKSNPTGFIHIKDLYSSAYSTKPTNVSLALEKTTFAQNEHVTYYCDGKSVHYFIISIYKGDGTLIETVQVNPGEYCTRYYDPGQYTAYCEAYNNCGNTFSNTINFTVTAPQGPSNVSLALEKKTFFSD